MTNEERLARFTGSFQNKSGVDTGAICDEIRGKYTLNQEQAEKIAESIERATGKESMRLASDEQMKIAREILASRNKDIPLLKVGENGAIQLDPNNPSHREWYENDDDYDI